MYNCALKSSCLYLLCVPMFDCFERQFHAYVLTFVCTLGYLCLSVYVLVGVDCQQSLHKSVERPAFLRQSCFVTQTSKMTEGGLGREAPKPPSVILFSCVTKDDRLRKAGRSTDL